MIIHRASDVDGTGNFPMLDIHRESSFTIPCLEPIECEIRGKCCTPFCNGHLWWSMPVPENELTILHGIVKQSTLI
jgi:hypothetical protein